MTFKIKKIIACKKQKCLGNSANSAVASEERKEDIYRATIAAGPVAFNGHNIASHRKKVKHKIVRQRNPDAGCNSIIIFFIWNDRFGL